MYCRAIRPVLEDILLTTHDYAMRTGDQNLERAAYRLHEHLLATETTDSTHRRHGRESVATGRSTEDRLVGAWASRVSQLVKSPPHVLHDLHLVD